MDKALKITAGIDIIADKEKVWDAMINPEKIKVYLFGTNTSSDWTKESEIIFQGEVQGQAYKDKGIIREIKVNEILQYSYWSGFTGLEDKAENYSLVTFRLDFVNGFTNLTLSQEGFVNEQSQQHSQTAWTNILQQIKELTEKG